MNTPHVRKLIAVSTVAILLSGVLAAKPRMQEGHNRMHHGANSQNEWMNQNEKPQNDRMMQKSPRGSDGQNEWMVDKCPCDDQQLRGAGTRGTMENSVIGDWVVRDTDKAVKLDLDRDGEMELEWQQNLNSSTEWEGFWTATDTELTFEVRRKKTKSWTNGVKKESRESMHESWKLQYTHTGDTLTLTSNSLPKELSGLTFYREGR